MFTLFNKKADTSHAHEFQLQRNLALSTTDLEYAKQVADFFNSNGIQAELIKPSCNFGPNMRLTMNGVTVVVRTIKAPKLLDIKDIRPYFSLVEVYKVNGNHKTPTPISNAPYIITNLGFTREAEQGARLRGLVLQFQPIVSPQMV